MQYNRCCPHICQHSLAAGRRFSTAFAAALLLLLLLLAFAAAAATSVPLPMQSKQRDVMAAASYCYAYSLGTKVNTHSLKQLRMLLFGALVVCCILCIVRIAATKRAICYFVEKTLASLLRFC
jgi:hypothetical protein